jgi:transcriptional regulator with XRE-family HTH domain
MALGRPTKKQRAPFGERLNHIRQRAGLSQQQVADRLGISRRAYSHWERYPVALRPEQMLELAEALDVSLDELIGGTRTAPGKPGPKSQLEKRMEAIAKLPRSTRQRIMAVLDAFIAQHKATS